MALYNYKAIADDGRAVFGRIDALNLVDLEMRLKRMDLDFVTGEAVAGTPLFGGRVPRRDLINFCFHLEQLSRSGVPILDSLADLRDSLDQPRFREVVASLIESVEGGLTLSEAMDAHRQVFDRVFVSLIRAGETTGRLPEVLESLVETLKWQDELASYTRKVMIYPAFVGTVVGGATLFLMVYMVPQLKQFVKYMGQTLPPQTQALFYLSDLLVAYWYLLAGLGTVAALVALFLFRTNPAFRLRVDGVRLRVPLVGPILRKIILARFASTFALLYSSGIPVLDSIRVTQTVAGNRVIRQALVRVEQLIVEGQQLTAAFHAVAIFPPLVIRMLRVGENTGALDRALDNVAYFYSRDVRESVEKVQAVIEPALTLILGALLGWVMLSVLGPIYDVISRIRP